MKLSKALQYADVPEKETIRALFTENLQLDGQKFRRNIDINCHISDSGKPLVIKLETFVKYIQKRKPELVNLVKYYGLKYLFSVKHEEKNSATTFLKKFVLIQMGDRDNRKYYVMRLKSIKNEKV